MSAYCIDLRPFLEYGEGYLKPQAIITDEFLNALAKAHYYYAMGDMPSVSIMEILNEEIAVVYREWSSSAVDLMSEMAENMLDAYMVYVDGLITPYAARPLTVKNYVLWFRKEIILTPKG